MIVDGRCCWKSSLDRSCEKRAIGIPAAYKEAIKFATKRSVTNNISAGSGAASFAIPGKISIALKIAQGLDNTVSVISTSE
jgi:hypothetical protein